MDNKLASYYFTALFRDLQHGGITYQVMLEGVTEYFFICIEKNINVVLYQINQLLIMTNSQHVWESSVLP